MSRDMHLQSVRSILEVKFPHCCSFIAVFTTEKDWGYYREVIRDKAASLTSFYQVYCYFVVLLILLLNFESFF